MALELYHSPYRLTMYYQGLLSLIAPSQMMICGTLTLRYLFRIVLSGAVAKGEDVITSGSVTRQGGIANEEHSFPIAFSMPFTALGTVDISTWNSSYNNYDDEFTLTKTSIKFRFFPHHFVAFGI